MLFGERQSKSNARSILCSLGCIKIHFLTKNNYEPLKLKNAVKVRTELGSKSNFLCQKTFDCQFSP